MTFLNPSVLLNMGAADAVKPAAGNTQSQESVANAPDEFAQALRKQMQQTNKSSGTTTGTDPIPRPLAKDMRESSRSAVAQSNGQLAAEQTQAPAAKTDEKQAQETQGDDSHDDQPTDGTKETSAADETPQARKKRLMAHLETADAQAAGLAPWMQTMMAMRPATGQGVINKAKGVSGDIAEDPLQSDALLAKATVVPGDTAEKARGVLPADTSVAEDSAGQGVEARQLSTDEPNIALADKNDNFTETLGIAKAVAAAVQQTAGTDKAASQLNQIETEPAISSLAQVAPAAQVMPNNAWLNAAGVSQGANVMMSQIATPFGNERWQAAMNQHVLNMVGSGDDVASLTLSPPDLGPIQVVLKVDNQSVNTSFISDNPLVRQALQDGMQDLRDRMQSQGLALGQTFVGNGEQAQQHFGQQASEDGSRAFGQGAQAGVETVAPAAAVRTTSVRGLVDTFV
ncbi:flagellar hook-length control protein FliK [Methylophilus rhizosphaerae]|uniref:Flagellar hook-length control protein FliK n=1 Tax=Methylophilus rhizosphaerae TaxID=492660 RepID=A0A1G8ZEU9_9PROT|nr:flagellar hook-length control protein FliK [Methylophilus rhizosphaerae]SDK12700.1 flagellar hook-length control protein FliK [Methylophilus rhizosphaerae]